MTDKKKNRKFEVIMLCFLLFFLIAQGGMALAHFGYYSVGKYLVYFGVILGSVTVITGMILKVTGAYER